MELINLIHRELPQIQCGRCDTPGCKQYAEAIAQGSPHDRCVPGGKETLNKLNDITAIQYEDVNDDYGPSIPNQKVKIIEEECIGCKKCIDACPIDAITGGTNMMHSIIDDICTGCELCIEPCPVDCIEITPLTDQQTTLPRINSQLFFDLKEKLLIDKKRNKLKNFSNENIEISNNLNTKINNRNINKSEMIDVMQNTIIKSDLSKLHNYEDEQIDSFIKENN